MTSLVPQYPHGVGCYIDCGAHPGDTIKNFVDFVDGKYKKIFALELDKKNFKELKDFVEKNNYKNVELLNCGAWNEKTQLSTANEGMPSATVSEHGKYTMAMDTIDNIVGDTHVDLIKMDIEGAELKALEGAVKTLKNSRPTLALSSYHRKEDLITLPQFVKKIYGNCRMYFRKDNFYNLFDFDLYVIPE